MPCKYTIRICLILIITHALSALNSFSAIPADDFILQKEKAIITGKVTDTEGNGLEYATVFIANTTFGTITNDKGEYALGNIPFGSQLLVVSYVGYQFKKTQINVNKESFTQNIQLKKIHIEIDEIHVSAEKSKNKWKQNFKKFEQNFIGTSENAQNCKITNPEHLRFHYDKKQKTLTAQSTEMLIIENKALGYKIQYVLEQFELHNNGSFKYIGSANFQPLTASSVEEEKLWVSNRKKAYYGSVKHFLRALYTNNLKKEGYYVKSVKSMIPLQSYDELYEKIPYEDPVGKELNILPGKYYYERKIQFNNYLYIVYTKEDQEYYFIGSMYSDYVSIPFQQSWIQLIKTQSEFNILGYFNYPNDVFFHGYWAYEKLAESLPIDYLPGK